MTLEYDFFMANTPILASGHTASDGTLNLKVDTGVPDSDVTVEIRVLPLKLPAVSEERDANGWPIGFFEKVAGSMPNLERAPQGDYEIRLPFE
jgi:hypothetical protein